MTRISEEMLAAFADGELGAEDRLEVERALATDESLRAELERLRGLRARLGAHFDPVLDEAPPARLRAMLEPQGAEIVDLAAARERRSRLFAWPQLAAMAASLAAGVIAGQLILSPAGGPVESADGALVARGALAEMLDTRLASAQPAGSAQRVGLSFADKEGRMCRTFEMPALEGIACREGGGWQLVMTAAAARAVPEYRQAGSPPLLAAAQEMMAGEPLDAAGERRARDRGWRAD